MEPVPLQDVERLKASANVKVMQGPELRTIFLGMDQKRDELLFSNVKGKNPFGRTCACGRRSTRRSTSRRSVARDARRRHARPR